MYYVVRHVTRFRYSAPISESVMEVRMQPRQEGQQQCLSFDLTTSPGARVMSRRDYLGNIVHHFSIPRSHSQLTITAQALVGVTAPVLPEALEPSDWAAVDALVADSDIAEMLLPSHFARPTAMLRELAREQGVARRGDPLTLLREISDGIHRTLRYTPNSTKVDSPIDDALRMRQGVCQDYAHIMTALVREVGIPCRYVSGYLARHGGNGQDQGAGATHAWVEALLPRLGWVGFDPTNNLVVGERHIRTAVGRDYADVPPTRGVFKGQAETELGVAVQVVLADEPLADDELLLTMQAMPPVNVGEQPQQQQQ
jgi:transglutaminase-like putative cysteine protease